MDLLRLDNVTKGYYHVRGNITALEPVSFAVQEDEFIAIVGPSGCGKSTLLRIIHGLVEPSGGAVLYKGEVQRGINPECAMVFQSFALFPWLTVLENVELGLEARKIPSKETRRRANFYIDKVGLDGSGLRLLVGGPTRDQSPTFSPGGARIAFTRSSGYDADIWTVSSDGAGARRLTRDPRGRPNLRQDSPDYSPDGRQIVFTQGSQIAIMRADGSGVRLLTHLVDPRAIGPVFSPDGRWIAFWTERRSAASTRTWVMKRDGSQLRTLNTGGFAAAEPTWQPLPGA